MEQRVYDSEIKLLEIIWENEPVSAKDVSRIASAKIGWSKNTTYTVLTKLESKGYISREDPGFICRSLVSKNEVQKSETRGLLSRLFGGSKKALFSSLLADEDLSEEELAELRALLGRFGDGARFELSDHTKE